jgi:enoyl-CoA hydratase/carnithine racemase
MDFRAILYEIKNQIARITLNRPDALNAINQEMSREIVEACSAAENDDGVRVVIFSGAGERAFSTGMDLKERAQGIAATPLERRHVKIVPGIHTPSKAVVAISKPTIAAIRGYAVGGGLELSLACDVRVASEDAKFGLTEVRRGILPGAGGTQRLSRVIGLSKALELCLSGDLIDAKVASRLGLVNDVVGVTELLPRAEALAVSFLKGAPISLRYIKEAIYKGWELSLEEGLRLEADLSAMIATTEDSKEGPRAFVEKREPVWKGR